MYLMLVGISVPEKQQTAGEEGKKKVRYVERQRKNKKKEDTGDSSAEPVSQPSPSPSAPPEVRYSTAMCLV